ncbi:MAG TPA: CNNM domain-containing protein [Chitinispirillaceae bacterium]|nr:CNNM domain-containing protein [Chitinispirillaceae bacterium]
MDFFHYVLISTFAIIFISAMAESCILSISNSDIYELQKSYPMIGRIWKRLKQSINHSFTLVLIFNTAAIILSASIGGAFISGKYTAEWFVPIAVLLSYVVIQWGIVLPRTLGIRFKKPLAVLFAVPLYLLTLICKPLIMIIGVINKPFEDKRVADNLSPLVEIATLAQSAASDHQISREQAHLIERSIQLSRMKARDIMVDCSEINFLSDKMSLDDALVASHMHHHTRFPLTIAGNTDEILGYVNFKDIVSALRVNPADPTLRGICRPIETVSDTIALSELLKKFTRSYQHIAMVKNESGKIIGMVTLEDLIEALVGELEDEYDKPPELLVQLSENRFRAGGGVTFEKMRKQVYNGLPDWDLSVDEWIFGQCSGDVPDNYCTSYQNVTFKVKRISRGHVYDLIIDRPYGI